MLRVLLYVVPLVLAVYALVDCIQTDDAAVRGLPKIGWIALIVLIWVIGPIAWLVAGKDRGAGRPRGRGVGRLANRRDPGPPGRTLAPDDDPEFLRSLRRSDQEHERMLEQWEQELRRREHELREPPDDDEGPGDDGPAPRR